MGTMDTSADSSLHEELAALLAEDQEPPAKKPVSHVINYKITDHELQDTGHRLQLIHFMNTA